MNYHYQYSQQIPLDWVLQKMPKFLFPDLSKKRSRIKKDFSGVLATLDKKPVGLILATFDPTGTQARIHSFIVHPEHRHKGVGTRLLKELEKAFVREDCRQVELYYRSHWKCVGYLEMMLTGCGWSEPEEELVIVRGETDRVIKLFVDRGIELPEGYAISPFSYLSKEERNEIIRKKQENQWYEDYLNPFLYENTMNPRSSLALKYEGEVIGWVISHLLSPTLNEFTSLFIDAGHRSYKLAHLLMREAITNQQADGIPNFMITSRADGNPMSRFLIRHAPHTGVLFTKALRSWKKLD